MKNSLSILLMLISISANSQSGLEIAKQARQNELGFISYSVDFKMLLRNSKGREIERQLFQNVIETKNDGNKSVLFFENPNDVKGTALLTYSHRSTDDDQWIFIPAINRVKRISSSNKSGSFMGSEFAFEDLGSQEIEKYNYNFIDEREINNKFYYAVERIPKANNSGYSRMIVYYNKKELRVEIIEFFDRKGEHIKTLTFNNFQLYEGKFWKAKNLIMVNHLSNKETELIFNNFKFGEKVDEIKFSPQFFFKNK